jgi:hypothetical protein
MQHPVPLAIRQGLADVREKGVDAVVLLDRRARSMPRAEAAIPSAV